MKGMYRLRISLLISEGRTVKESSMTLQAHQKRLSVCTSRQKWLCTGTEFPHYCCSHRRTHECCRTYPDTEAERQELQVHGEKKQTVS